MTMLERWEELRPVLARLDVLAGRRALVSSDRDGLSSANRKCDLVQLRSTASGTTVRLHMWK